ncbi:hypothetical protein TVAG_064210 [Trichomonas vaginalis G3]|uniref:Uncharacterized protein n=1 Tax=Trichomonas vaginalis (strain ATCC PRA-98 / G3) TaxID=412133 RepID=A2FBY1_TRIV3|nr:hypothetical protein TVAGG3_0488640 [Trichomonas vaginalis G3]EAX97580.1 hypothetical protein TVAG_064210 [Trichomonas vaginalis G3]KAI5516219.1 hypothetical protein TVAGG3_0488640 [Trichomonas vaginalis G3]|eukprot:XP_001310510.1 hypothetical protein [Trichomonas vaginalis G3]
MNPEQIEAFKRQVIDYSETKAHISLDNDMTIDKMKELRKFGILLKPKVPKQFKMWELAPSNAGGEISIEFFEALFGFQITPEAFIGIPAPVEEIKEPERKSQENFKNEMPKPRNTKPEKPEKQEKKNNFSIHINEQPRQQQQYEEPQQAPEPVEQNQKTGAFRIKPEATRERQYPRQQPRYNEEYRRPPMPSREENEYFDDGQDNEEQRPIRNRGRRFDRPGYERQEDFGRQGGYDRQGGNHRRNYDQNYYEDHPRDKIEPERPPINRQPIQKPKKSELSHEDFPALEPTPAEPVQDQKQEEPKEAAPVQEEKEKPKQEKYAWKGVLEDEPPIDDDEEWKKIRNADYIKAVKNDKTLIIGGNSYLIGAIHKFIKKTIQDNLEDGDDVDVDELFDGINQIQFK